MPTHSSSPLPARFALLLVVCLAGCAGELDAPERFTPPGTSPNACPSGVTATALIQQKCVACHTTSSPSGGLDLEASGLPGRLYTTNSTACGQQRPLADSTTPANSYFLQKLQPGVTCGARMPVGSPLSTEEVSCLAEWLASGQGS